MLPTGRAGFKFRCGRFSVAAPAAYLAMLSFSLACWGMLAWYVVTDMSAIGLGNDCI